MVKEKEAKHIDLSIDETNLEVINKLIVACYINPTKSFRIKLKKNWISRSYWNRRNYYPLNSLKWRVSKLRVKVLLW